jgi:hypothetical protein
MVLGLTACTELPIEVTCERDYPPALPLDLAFTECEVDDDCVALELGLCDHCNGGEVVAVSDATQGEILERHQECLPDTGQLGCTEMACEILQAACLEGVCTLVEATLY